MKNKVSSGLLTLLLIMGIMNTGIVLINGLLAQYTNLYLAGLIIHAIGLVPALILFMLFDGDKIANWMPTFKENKIIFISGFLGSIILIISAYSMSIVGVFVTSIAMVAGQFIVSLIIDMKGYFGFEKIKLEGRKITAILIILLGIALISL